MYIAIEGNIAAGKSTLSKKIGEILNFKVVEEPVEENRMLPDFYNNPKDNALPLQFWLLTTRAQLHKEAIDWILDGMRPPIQFRGAVADRTIYGDAVFERVNYILGNISEYGHKCYQVHRDWLIKQLHPPHAIVYLDVEPEECFRRKEELRGRSFEQGSKLTLDYLRLLRDNYEIFINELKERGFPVFRFDWNDCARDPNNVIDRVIGDHEWGRKIREHLR
jgi:deoxyadenosine/deoxycytidine kinase